MDSSETLLPPLPSSRKRKAKPGKRGAMNRSRSFVAEMFHINQTNPHKKWSNNDMELLSKLGISPHDTESDADRLKMKLSPNLHPDLKQHAYEEQINSLYLELQESKNNLLRATEYGQYLIDGHSNLETVVLELRNEAAEYIAQIVELREENDRIKMEIQNNEYSVNDYHDKICQYKTNKQILNDEIINLKNELTDITLKYEMEQNKSKLYKEENEKYEKNENKLSIKYNNETDELRTKILILQNTNHSLLMEKDEILKKYEKIQHQKNLLENEYNDICNQYKGQMDGGSISGDSQHRFIISRRNSHSRSRSHKKEDLEEKMDEIIGKNTSIHSGSDTDNEYKSDPKYNEYGVLLVECMNLFENIIDEQYMHSPGSSAITTKHNIINNIDIELFKDLKESVRKKLMNDKYGGDLHKRNMNELRRNSKSANSNLTETLDHYIMSSDDMEEELEENKEFELGMEVSNDNAVLYEADNEDLDNLSNKDMFIEKIDDKKRKCVEQFLVRYSEDNAWNDNNDKNENKYEIEIEFNENINLENKKKNNISISSNILQSLTNLIENIMNIQYDDHSNSPYFSMCGWFCGQSPINISNYSSHYLNILSSLDYNSKNRDEIYWVIYQLLNIIYKYYNHTQRLNDNHNHNDNHNDGNKSDSESISMVLTQTKSKYAELKPPSRKMKKNVICKSKSRGSFTVISNKSSDDDESQR